MECRFESHKFTLIKALEVDSELMKIESYPFSSDLLHLLHWPLSGANIHLVTQLRTFLLLCFSATSTH